MERRLAAILAADVVGYSRHMGADDARTLQRLMSLRKELVQPKISEHHGRTVKLMGDGLLAEFASVVEAVQCAVDIQQGMIGRETDLPDENRIKLRIGINLGDIMIQGSDIYGDGVNVAARLEAQADPGGVCISSVVCDQIRQKVDAEFVSGGSKALKNIAEPVEIWNWVPQTQNVDTFPAEQMPLSEKLSIAVLPFDNMSGDPEQEYFSDGISEDIITDLSKIGSLLVIARNSSFAYKGASINARAVAAELGVRYLLEGSVRRSDNRVRVTAQLIDAETGGHLWADRFDRELKDIFALQDDVTQQIVDALQVTLSGEEQARLADGGTTSVEAYDCFLRGREIIFGASRADLETFTQSVAQFQQAIKIDPDYAIAYSELTRVYLLDFQAGWSGDPDRSLLEAGRRAEIAIVKDANESAAHYAAAIVAMFNKDFERWAAEIEIALALNPNFALAISAKGLLHIFTGNPQDAISYIERAIRLDPGYYQQYLHFQGLGYLVAGEYQDAVEAFKKRISLMPETDLSRGFLAVALGHLGHVDEARHVWQELVEINPEYSLEQHMDHLPFRHPAEAERIADGLRKAGLPV